MMQGLLNSRAVSEVQTIQEAKVVEFTSKLARLPTDLRDHVRWCCIPLTVAIMPMS